MADVIQQYLRAKADASFYDRRDGKIREDYIAAPDGTLVQRFYSGLPRYPHLLVVMDHSGREETVLSGRVRDRSAISGTALVTQERKVIERPNVYRYRARLYHDIIRGQSRRATP